MKLEVSNSNQPTWHNLTVSTELPKQLKPLEEMSKNLWWVWNSEGKSLFRDLDHDLWRKVGENPVMLLQQMSYERLKEILDDKAFMDRIKLVYASYKDYMKQPMRNDISNPSQKSRISHQNQMFGNKTYQNRVGNFPNLAIGNRFHFKVLQKNAARRQLNLTFACAPLVGAPL